MKCYLGIDLGGTNVRVAKITEDGQILSQVKGPSYGQEGPAKVMANIKSMVREIPDWKECSGIGIAVPGPVDTKPAPWFCPQTCPVLPAILSLTK